MPAASASALSITSVTSAADADNNVPQHVTVTAGSAVTIGFSYTSEGAGVVTGHINGLDGSASVSVGAPSATTSGASSMTLTVPVGTLPGAYTIQLKLDDVNNADKVSTVGSAVTVSVTITVVETQLSLTADNATYDGNSHGATATVTPVAAAGTVSFLYTGTGSTIYSSIDAPTDAGTYHVAAQFTPDDPVHYSPSSGSADFEILKAGSAVTITGDSGTTIYSGAGHSYSASVSGINLSGAVDVAISVWDGTAYVPFTGDPTDAGKYLIEASFGGDANHSGSSASVELTINKAPSAVTITGDSGTKVYSGLGHPYSAGVSGINLSAAVAVTISVWDGTAYVPLVGDPTDAGQYLIEASYAGDANHDGSSASLTLTIEKAPSTVTITGASGTTTYNGSAHSYSASVSGANLSGAVAVTISVWNGSAYVPFAGDPTDAGKYLIEASYGGDSNHTGSSASLTLTIEKASSSVVFDGPFVFNANGSPQSPTAHPAGAGTVTGGVTYEYFDSLGNSLGATAPTHHGSYSVKATYAGDANHTGSSATTGFVINVVTEDANASTQAALNIAKMGSLSFTMTATPGSDLSWFNGSSIKLSLTGMVGNVLTTKCFDLTQTATYDAVTGTLTVSWKVDAAMKSFLTTFLNNATPSTKQPITFGLTGSAFGGDFLLNETATSGLFYSTK